MSRCRLALLALLLLPAALLGDEDRDLIARFKLTDQHGKRIVPQDLQGRVCIVSFVLCNCPDSKCPQVMRTVAQMQDDLADRNVLFVTFTVNPAKDTPERLKDYAETFGADPHRWLFLTGDYDEIDRVVRSLRFRAGPVKRGALDHSQKLVLLDRAGYVRGYYDGMRYPSLDTEEDYQANLRKLKRDVDALLKPPLPAWMPKDFPRFNASLNALAAVLILLGYAAIRQRLTRLHIACMLTALMVSALFLASYLFFHLYVKGGQPTRFSQQAVGAPPWAATTYAVILISHTILAVFATPMAVISTWFGLRNRIPQHRRLAKWTFPIWLYVSVTGVVVYWMLYRAYPVP